MPRNANPIQQRRRITDSAFRVLARDGLDQFTMRRVAKEAGCTIGLITHWFSSKEDLIVAAWYEAMAREDARLAPVRSKRDISLESQLTRSLPTTAAARQDALVWIAFCALTVSNRMIRLKHRDRFHFARSAIECLLISKHPELRDRDRERTTDLILAVLTGLNNLCALDPGNWPADRQRAVLAAALAPVASRPSRSGRS